jgi:hypothetical protein
VSARLVDALPHVGTLGVYPMMGERVAFALLLANCHGVGVCGERT